MVYLLIKRFGGKSNFMIGCQSKLSKMLFYSSFIRYLIKSNLILTHNNFFFLAFMMSFKTVSEAVSSIMNIVILIVVIVWPIAMSRFLIRNQNKLD